jgi:hypothetical protein
MMSLFENFSCQNSNKTMAEIAVLGRYFLQLRGSKKKKKEIVSKMRKCSAQGCISWIVTINTSER